MFDALRCYEILKDKPFILYCKLCAMLQRQYLHFVLLILCALSVFWKCLSDGITEVVYLPDDFFFQVNHPEEINYIFRVRPAVNFGVPFKKPLYDVHLVPVDPIHGCSKILNADLLNGAVALLERGECSFVSKAVQAEKAGAVAVIIADMNPEEDEVYIDMSDDHTNRNPQIPVAFLLGKDGFMIQHTLKKAGYASAIIDIPYNVTAGNVLDDIKRQPPWVLW